MFSLFEKRDGRLASGVAEYPLNRSVDDRNFATQSHAAQMDALDTTGSSVIPAGENLQPLDDYYLWCDHRAWREAQEITAVAREAWCAGGSSAGMEGTGCAKGTASASRGVC